ncbi:hypothetical protein CDO87_14305 [Sagittula sp. P11]|uniref:helix-turn-helix transcriptional regulator n=1 Tax=Sagittula sp. P11 TaxID=2009329 RepID=UPI000C2D39E5|nr:autoinducer binding domain-containing protein [Sagittula sp. P11]AUC54277.1 hypothetical protein CDO87_14305 [Sagittula sp. P11]
MRTNSEQVQFDTFGYVTFCHAAFVQTDANSTFSSGWEDIYFRERYHLVDPVIGFGQANFGRSAATVLDPAQMAGALFEEARAHSADSNVAMVSHFGGSTRIFGGVNHDLDARALPVALESLQADHRRDLAAGLRRLSDMQLDLLDLAEEGHSDKVIANELGVSHSLIAQRKRAICETMGMTCWRGVVQLYTLDKWHGIVPGEGFGQ